MEIIESIQALMGLTTVITLNVGTVTFVVVLWAIWRFSFICGTKKSDAKGGAKKGTSSVKGGPKKPSRGRQAGVSLPKTARGSTSQRSRGGPIGAGLGGGIGSASRGVGQGAGAALSGLGDTLAGLGRGIGHASQGLGAGLGAILTGSGGAIKGTGEGAGAVIKGTGEGVGAVAKGVGGHKLAFEIGNGIGNVTRAIRNEIVGDAAWAWNEFKEGRERARQREAERAKQPIPPWANQEAKSNPPHLQHHLSEDYADETMEQEAIIQQPISQQPINMIDAGTDLEAKHIVQLLATCQVSAKADGELVVINPNQLSQARRILNEMVEYDLDFPEVADDSIVITEDAEGEWEATTLEEAQADQSLADQMKEVTAAWNSRKVVEA